MHPNAPTLSDYVDRALGGTEEADVERHLEACAACRGLAADLGEIRRATKALTPIDPPAAVWLRVEEAIRLETPASLSGSTPDGRAVTARSRQIGWLALAATLVLATVIGLRLGPLVPADGGGSDTPATTADEASGDAAQTVESELRQAEEHYDKAIKGLELITNEGQSALDPTTAATLQKNLSVIDQAISESRAAVLSEPNSEPAQSSLLENFTTKISLLQDTVSLINEMRKGNDAGAAQIVSGPK